MKGNNNSKARYALLLLIAGGMMYLICIFYGLWWWVSALVMLVGLWIVPGLLKQHYLDSYNTQQFSQVDIYLHQMAYSFMRKPKINLALKDAKEIAEEPLRGVIEKCIDELDYGFGTDIYTDSLSIIEKEYDCERVKSLHSFMKYVEHNGGEYESALRILIDDFDRWTSNIYKSQSEIKKIKRDIGIGIIISLLLAGATTIMCSMLNTFSKDAISIVDTYIFQLYTASFLIMNVLFFYGTRRMFNYDWLKKSRTDRQIKKDYELIFNSQAIRMTLVMIPVWMVFVLVGMFLFISGKYIYGLAVIFAMAVIMLNPFYSKVGARKRITKDLYIGFTEWLRKLAINMNNKPLIAAVEDTYEDSPVILKRSLGKFIGGIEKDPTDIVPYYDFLSEFQVTDISAAVRTLYSVGELDKDGMRRAIDTLVRRNLELSDKAEQSEHTDRVSMMRFSEYIPTFFVGFKMAADMMLVVTMYL